MGIDISLLREQCQRTLYRTQLEGLGQRLEAKVRDNYIQGDLRIIVVSDRVSAFDVIVGTLPFKGQILNQLAAFWCEKTVSTTPNHVIAVPDPCVSVVRELKVLPVEFVYRGYLTGVSNTSIWRAETNRRGNLAPKVFRFSFSFQHQLFCNSQFQLQLVAITNFFLPRQKNQRT